MARTIGQVRRGQAWRDGARRRQPVPRLAPFATLVLGGVRASELCLLTPTDILRQGPDGGLIDVPPVKRRGLTDADFDTAERRQVPIIVMLRRILDDHAARWLRPDATYLFETAGGRRNTPANVLKFIVRPVWHKANELLARDGQPPIRHASPHTLCAERTPPSCCAPRRATYLP